jgi:hypothetical protein
MTWGSPGDKQVKTPSAPPEMLQDIQAGNQDTKAFQEAMFISILTAAQWIPIQRLRPKGFPYILLQAGYRSNPNMGLTRIWSYASLLATSPSVLCDLSHIHIL